MDTQQVPENMDKGGSGDTLAKGGHQKLDMLNSSNISASEESLASLDKIEETCPESYTTNSSDETRLLAIADNFQKQYTLLYPYRKPLLLCPVNEFGVKKFVSTTLRPTMTSHPQFLNWEGCASFVADFLALKPLEPPFDLPGSLFSCTYVLQKQEATCFEYATLLCSLLIGTDYDAYCVSGYTVKEICLLDQSNQECPLLDTEVQVTVETSEQEPLNIYIAKPLTEPQSRFVEEQERKRLEAEAALLRRAKLEQERRQTVRDPLLDLRVHCWVLVLSGGRDIKEDFFIDPLTGNRYGVTHSDFLGIESMWNDLNYYVNMQDCRGSCADVKYDLDDIKLWEPILYGGMSKQKKAAIAKKKKKMGGMTMDGEEDEQPQVFKMPRSWVSFINISKKDLETRWIGGKKLIRYRKAELETFCPYLMTNGMVKRLTTYSDHDYTQVVMVKEWFQRRSDDLVERDVNVLENFTIERFAPGRRFQLLYHRFTETDHEMIFDSDFRLDGLLKKVMTPTEMTETFEGRDDFLYYRHIVLDHEIQNTDGDLTFFLEGQQLLKILERFHRNRNKPANEDVAERVFFLAQRRIELIYHLDDQQFITSKMSFIKPLEATEYEKCEDFRPDMVCRFQVDPFEKPPTLLILYEVLMDLKTDEKKVAIQLKKAKKEIRDILACREQEMKNLKLHICPWSSTGAAMALNERQEMERQAAEEQRWLEEKEKDLLAPFLIRQGVVDDINAGNAKQLYQDCLSNFKERMIEQAGLVQERYEKATQELQRKQQWYQKNQLSMTAQEQEEYQSFCSQKTLQIEVTKKRLSMHKEAAAQKFNALDEKLKQDPRLAPHLFS